MSDLTSPLKNPESPSVFQKYYENKASAHGDQKTLFYIRRPNFSRPPASLWTWDAKEVLFSEVRSMKYEVFF